MKLALEIAMFCCLLFDLRIRKGGQISKRELGLRARKNLVLLPKWAFQVFETVGEFRIFPNFTSCYVPLFRF